MFITFLDEEAYMASNIDGQITEEWPIVCLNTSVKQKRFISSVNQLLVNQIL